MSRQPDYVSTLRANALRGIRFQQVVFRAQGYTPLYIGPGVTEAEMVDTIFLGGADGVIIYLDAESSRNLICGNQSQAESDLGVDSRENIAIDGSDYNRIIGNCFSALDHGGIYLYRNCGQVALLEKADPQEEASRHHGGVLDSNAEDEETALG